MVLTVVTSPERREANAQRKGYAYVRDREGAPRVLEEVADEYDMADESKALRVLLDYAVQDVSKDLIFSDENMRCHFCG